MKCIQTQQMRCLQTCIQVKNLIECKHIKPVSTLDNIWLSAPAVGLSPIYGWGGFNQFIYENQDEPAEAFQIREVETLPFIRLKADDYNCLYSAIRFAEKQAYLHDQRNCILTFDQPLF